LVYIHNAPSSTAVGNPLSFGAGSICGVLVFRPGTWPARTMPGILFLSSERRSSDWHGTVYLIYFFTSLSLPPPDFWPSQPHDRFCVSSICYQTSPPCAGWPFSSLSCDRGFTGRVQDSSIGQKPGIVDKPDILLVLSFAASVRG
jgi:hypothetical protein